MFLFRFLKKDEIFLENILYNFGIVSNICIFVL